LPPVVIVPMLFRTLPEPFSMTTPWLAPVPEPLEMLLSRPVVPPWAAAE